MALAYGKKDKASGDFEKTEKSGLVSMELDDEDKLDNPIMVSDRAVHPDYPYGLRISLTENELEKLKLDHKEASVGDYLNLRVRACVKSISEHDDGGGKCCRMELQIEEMGKEGK